MKIEVFGPGCAKCKASAEAAKLFLSERGIPGEVVKVRDFAEIAARGVLRTPAVIIDGEKVLEGRQLRHKDLADWLDRRGG